jgi:hypothetical protein
VEFGLESGVAGVVSLEGVVYISLCMNQVDVGCTCMIYILVFKSRSLREKTADIHIVYTYEISPRHLPTYSVYSV